MAKHTEPTADETLESVEPVTPEAVVSASEGTIAIRCKIAKPVQVYLEAVTKQSKQDTGLIVECALLSFQNLTPAERKALLTGVIASRMDI